MARTNIKLSKLLTSSGTIFYCAAVHISKLLINKYLMWRRTRFQNSHCSGLWRRRSDEPAKPNCNCQYPMLATGKHTRELFMQRQGSIVRTETANASMQCDYDDAKLETAKRNAIQKPSGSLFLSPSSGKIWENFS